MIHPDLLNVKVLVDIAIGEAESAKAVVGKVIDFAKDVARCSSEMSCVVLGSPLRR